MRLMTLIPHWIFRFGRDPCCERGGPPSRSIGPAAALGDTHGVEAKTAVRSERLADEALLKEMAKRKHNLIVMGVERRPGEKLYFGETATAILEKTDRSIVFVVS